MADKWSTTVSNFAKTYCGNGRPVADLNAMKWHSEAKAVAELRQPCERIRGGMKIPKKMAKWKIRSNESRLFHAPFAGWY